MCPFAHTQVHIFIPESSNPLYGISTRVILRDAGDMNLGRQSQVWLDTNGMVGNDVFAGKTPVVCVCVCMRRMRMHGCAVSRYTHA